MKHPIILSHLLALTVLPSFAQGLHQEVEIEREIVPVERRASRIEMLPEIALPPLTPVKLSFSDRTVTAPVNPAFTPLEPVATTDGLFDSTQRGYLRLGIFPLYNADLAAGYKILDTDRTRLNAWMKYGGHVYRKDIPAPDGDRRYWRNNTITADVSLHQAIGKVSMLDAGVNYTYSRYNMWNRDAAAAGYSLYNQWVNRFDANVAFSSRTQGLSYLAGVKFDRFSYGLKEADGVSQNLFGLDLRGAIEYGEKSLVALNVNADFLRTSADGKSSTTGLIALSPRYIFTTEDKAFTARAGVKLNIAVNDGKVFHIAPDLMAAWNPTAFFGIELTARGGSILNPLSSLWDVTPYCLPTVYYGKSSIPLDFNGKIMFGPFHGLYLRLDGGFAKADDFLMPLSGMTPAGNGVMFSATDIKAWHAGARIGWDSRYVSLSVGYENSPSRLTKAYYLNRDRAAHLLDSRLTIRPMKGMEFEAGYSLRACRAIYEATVTGSPIEGMPVYSFVRHNLGNAVNLTFSARYELTDNCSVFLEGENLLNRHYLYLGDRPAQGITGLVGFNLKF